MKADAARLDQASAPGLRVDGVDLGALATRVPTPCYVYSSSAIRERIDALRSALHGLDALVCFAVKANPNLAILQLMADAGFGADIVSAGELRRSLRAGIPAARIVFSGVGKTREEIGEALEAGIWKFNVESGDELHLLNAMARSRNCVARAAVRINPDIDAHTHEKISTGRSRNKFGVGIAEARSWFAAAGTLTHVQLDGLHAHIGSQILSLVPLRRSLQALALLWRELQGEGHRISSIDVGGGLGVRYRPDQEPPVAVTDYVSAIREAFPRFRGRLVLEPGRCLVAQAGLLLTRVIRVKRGEQRSFLVLDAAMNDLLRPSLYDAWHEITPLHGAARPSVYYDVVGPVCETGDTFATDRLLPACQPGDLVMISGAGAYGASMASTYNSRPLLAEVLLDEGRYAVIRRRQTYREMIGADRLPGTWLKP
jgi:diaminopimelate decarboxylase